MTDPHHDELAYVAVPDGGSGPTVLVVHSWWGLTPSFTTYADRLASRGFVVGCADLYDGAVAETELEARRLRAERREPAYRRLRRALVELTGLGGVPGVHPAVVGFSMGGHWAVWMAQHPDPPVAAAVVYYAARGGDFSRATAPMLAHFADDDRFVSASARRGMERAIAERGLRYAAHEYPGTEHWFAESSAAAYEPDAASLALDRSASFLAGELG